jgi:acetyl esterase/lipase
LPAKTNVVEGEPKPSLNEEEVIRIPMRDGYSSELRIFNPTGSSPAKGPLFVLMYGGSFMAGNNKSFAPTARALVSCTTPLWSTYPIG